MGDARRAFRGRGGANVGVVIDLLPVYPDAYPSRLVEREVHTEYRRVPILVVELDGVRRAVAALVRKVDIYMLELGIEVIGWIAQPHRVAVVLVGCDRFPLTVGHSPSHPRPTNLDPLVATLKLALVPNVIAIDAGEIEVPSEAEGISQSVA